VHLVSAEAGGDGAASEWVAEVEFVGEEVVDARSTAGRERVSGDYDITTQHTTTHHCMLTRETAAPIPRPHKHADEREEARLRLSCMLQRYFAVYICSKSYDYAIHLPWVDGWKLYSIHQAVK